MKHNNNLQKVNCNHNLETLKKKMKHKDQFAMIQNENLQIKMQNDNLQKSFQQQQFAKFAKMIHSDNL